MLSPILVVRSHPGSEKPTELLDGITREIAAMIDNPEVELSKVMREKAEESVLRAYLDGLNSY